MKPSGSFFPDRTCLSAFSDGIDFRLRRPVKIHVPPEVCFVNRFDPGDKLPVGKVAGGAFSGPPSACASCPNGLPTLKLLF